jgi:hypothetical protein
MVTTSPRRIHRRDVRDEATIDHLLESATIIPSSGRPGSGRAGAQLAASGASRPLRRIPAMVSFLKPIKFEKTTTWRVSNRMRSRNRQ